MNAQTSSRQRVILNEEEFEYLQNMLDFGSSIEQALMQIRPEMQNETWQFENLVITVHRTHPYN